MKLWKISERCRRYSNLNTVTDDGMMRDENTITSLKVPVKVSDDISIEAMPRRIFANAHTYHINSISVNSDGCTYLSADDLRVNLWDLERTDQSFSILAEFKVLFFICICTLSSLFLYAFKKLWISLQGRLSEEIRHGSVLSTCTRGTILYVHSSNLRGGLPKNHCAPHPLSEFCFHPSLPSLSPSLLPPTPTSLSQSVHLSYTHIQYSFLNVDLRSLRHC